MVSALIEVLVHLFQILDIPLSSVVVISIGYLIQTTTTLLDLINHDLDSTTRPNLLNSVLNPTSYDFIIVGGGSAGSVIAARLSENPNFSVLLLEAGSDPLILNSIPVLAVYNTYLPETNWMYRTVPQVNCALSSPNQAVNFARGKSLGGSSNLNFMIYMRGNPKDFDNWANLTGDSQWSYENVLPFFRKSEDYKGNYVNPKYHGTGGPLRVSKQEYQILAKEWMVAAAELGFNNSDANARQEQTFYPLELTMRNGSRESTYEAFLKPALKRTNLVVIRYAHVMKINLDSENKRAIGVTYRRHGKIISIRANKEVILSAGAFGSPQILMLSGIGDTNHLKSVGIEPKVSLPGVGENLQDHFNTFVGPFLLNSGVSFNPDRELTIAATTEYVLKKTGPFTYALQTGIAVLSTPNNEDQSWGNILAIHVPTAVYARAGRDFENIFGLKEGVLTKYFEGFVGQDANFVHISIGLPKSKGTVKLQSSDPFDSPLINPMYYSDPEDMQTMTSAMSFFVNFYEDSKIWNKFGANLIPKAFPGCEKFKLKSDEYNECYARHFTSTTWHPCCTAKMGRSDDSMAVVDSKLRVRKVKGLRVADASVMPRITNANLNAPVIMIAEKAADLILKEYRDYQGGDSGNTLQKGLPVNVNLPL